MLDCRAESGSLDQSIAAQATNKPDTFIAETGWPTASMNASEASDGAGSPQGDASVANLQSEDLKPFVKAFAESLGISLPGHVCVCVKQERDAVFLVRLHQAPGRHMLIHLQLRSVR